MSVTTAKPVVMSKSGLAALRIVLSSYFIALSLGLISGTDITAIAKLGMYENFATFVMNLTLFICAYFVLMGIYVRGATLVLTAILLSNSAFATFLHEPAMMMSDFWRDVALSAGLLMAYLQSQPFRPAEARVPNNPVVNYENQRQVAGLRETTSAQKQAAAQLKLINHPEIANIFIVDPV